MLATALAPVIGYDEAAKLAKEAFKSGRTIRELALERGMAADGARSAAGPGRDDRARPRRWAGRRLTISPGRGDGPRGPIVRGPRRPDRGPGAATTSHAAGRDRAGPRRGPAGSLSAAWSARRSDQPDGDGPDRGERLRGRRDGAVRAAEDGHDERRDPGHVSDEASTRPRRRDVRGVARSAAERAQIATRPATPPTSASGTSDEVPRPVGRGRLATDAAPRRPGGAGDERSDRGTRDAIGGWRWASSAPRTRSRRARRSIGRVRAGRASRLRTGRARQRG